MSVSRAQLLEVYLKSPDDFLIVKETLTRIGIASARTKTLYQTCHILHKRGKYYILHFKELFALDGKPASFDEKDLQRRNTIAHLLHEWKLVTIVDPELFEDRLSLSHITIIPHNQKRDWTLEPKYTIGTKKNAY
jgi:hypothetical protein